MGTIVDTIIGDIYGLQDDRRDKPRTYLGASIIGHPCNRRLWYGFRGCLDEAFPSRILRLFETGHREEERLLSDLRAAGYEVLARNPRTRKQFEVVSFAGLFQGHLDGLIRIGGEWFVLEIKTSSSKAFRAVKKHGVGHEKPEHYAQIQIYLGFATAWWDEWGLGGEPPTRAIYLVHAKENDELYGEIVLFDPDDFAKFGEKARFIIESKDPPPKLSEKADYYLCRWCDYQGICHSDRVPRVDCRTCMHGRVDPEAGRWVCCAGHPCKPRKACPSHLFLPVLLEPRLGRFIEASPDFPETAWACYELGVNRTEKSGVDGKSSRELSELPWEKP